MQTSLVFQPSAFFELGHLHLGLLFYLCCISGCEITGFLSRRKDRNETGL